MSYTTESAHGQHYRVGSGETFGNYLFNVANGGGLLISSGPSSNYVVQNIGLNGYYEGGGFIMSTRDRSHSGQSLVQNVYMGDGCSKSGESFVHGPGGIFVGARNEHLGHITFRNCNIQGYTNNGFYASNGPGTVRFENCLAKNNGVSSFRCRSNGRIHNCVAYNDNTQYGWFHRSRNFVEKHGRCVWVWGGGGGRARITNSHFASGPYGGNSVVTHGGGAIRYESGTFDGQTQGNVSVSGAVSTPPQLAAPAGVPMTAVQAASGEGGSGGGWTQPSPAPDAPDPEVHQYGAAFHGGGTVTDSDFTWKTDGRPVWSAEGVGGSVSARFDPEPDTGASDLEDVEVDTIDGTVREDPPEGAPEEADDVIDNAEGFPTLVDLTVHDCYIADVEGPAVHIGAIDEDATAVVRNVHIDGADYGIIADGCTVEVIDCEVVADVPFGTVNGGELIYENTNHGENANPTMAPFIPATAWEAASGRAFEDL